MLTKWNFFDKVYKPQNWKKREREGEEKKRS
jgi:hypothetical protein